MSINKKVKITCSLITTKARSVPPVINPIQPVIATRARLAPPAAIINKRIIARRSSPANSTYPIIATKS